MKVLVTGGPGAGKSRYAESLLADRYGVRHVRPGRGPSGPPSEAGLRHAWETYHTADLVTAVEGPDPVLVDSLSSWLDAVLGDQTYQDSSRSFTQVRVEQLLHDVLAVLPPDAVVVTTEVGAGIPLDRDPGGMYGELLREVNRRAAAACDEIHWVVDGQVSLA